MASEEKEFLLQFFTYAHLPPKLQEVSKDFSILAERIMELPRNPERTTALRKLLEAKDCAVRAKLADNPLQAAINAAHEPRPEPINLSALRAAQEDDEL